MTARQSDRAAAWLVLLSAGGTMAAFNIWHALHSGMIRGLAWLVGVIIVIIVMGVSHVAAGGSGRVRKAVTFGVMVGAMVLSVRATGDVVRPAFGSLWWLFGAVVDSAALVCLQVILAPAQERNATAPEPPAPLPVPAPAVPPVSAPAPRRRARKSAPAEDLSTELRALQLLDEKPELRGPRMGAELARQLGVHESHGRRLHKRLTAQDRPGDPLNERSDERSR